MSRNGSGSYSLPSGNPVNNGTTIDPNWANNTMTDISTALTQSISQDGQTPITNNLPMTGFRHTNVANAQNRNEYASAAQCQDNAFEWLTSISGTDTITAVAAIGMGAYAAGQCFRFVSSGANTTTSVTLNLNGLGAKAITKNGATALAVGDIPSGSVVEVVYDGTQFQLVGTSVNNASTATSLTGTSTASVQTTALGSGTADNTTFLRGDRTFQTIATMTATTGGLVPTPPNDVNQVLRGNGTFGAASLGRLYNITRYTTAGSGTYTKPANINRLWVRAIGGGGGSGGSSSAAGGGGGGGGGYGDLFITSPAASYAYSVGASGTGGGGNGATGGATTIAGISAGGGIGGIGGSGSVGGTGGSGGSTSGGGTNMRGGPGGAAAVAAGGSTSTGGNGGNCVLGGGGIGGGNGAGPSVGLSGGGAGGATGSVGGSNGGPGYIEIWEFE